MKNKSTVDLKGTELEALLDQLPNTYPQLVQRTNKPGTDMVMSRKLWQAIMSSVPMILEATYKADRLKAVLCYNAKLKDFGHTAFPEPKRKLKPAELEFLHGLLGLISESGELLEMFINRISLGLPIDRTNAIEELGDASFFLQVCTRAVQSRAEEIQQVNILKLVERFPDGFSELKALVRDQEKELETLKSAIEKAESNRTTD